MKRINWQFVLGFLAAAILALVFYGGGAYLLSLIALPMD